MQPTASSVTRDTLQSRKCVGTPEIKRDGLRLTPSIPEKVCLMFALVTVDFTHVSPINWWKIRRDYLLWRSKNEAEKAATEFVKVLKK